MSSFVKKLEVAANIAIIITALLLSVVLAKHYLVNGSEQTLKEGITDSGEQNITGKKVALHDIDWKNNKRTLLLALSTTCHFCTDSSPFYVRLTKVAKSAHLIAVFPQSTEDGKQYLNSHGVGIEDVHQSTMGSLGVQGTPTLILVDDKGVVLNSWVGKLPADREAEVLSQLE
jgi:thioredoxin-related protein